MTFEPGDLVRVTLPGSYGWVYGEVARIRKTDGAVEVVTGQGSYLFDPSDLDLERRAGD